MPASAGFAELFFALQELIQPAPPYKITQEHIPHSHQNREQYKMSRQHITHDNVFNHNAFNDVPLYPPAADQRSEILTWLSPLNSQIRHNEIRTRRVDEVGDWLFQTEEYRKWFGRRGEPDGAALFCYGALGVGKTYIR